MKKLTESAYAQEYYDLEARNRENGLLKKEAAEQLNRALKAGNTPEADRLAGELNHYLDREKSIRSEVASLIKKRDPGGMTKTLTLSSSIL
ncbi:MAG: hypothetical protein LRY55_02305 [Leadbetterella sp.]|nr:hypothetical protein [Leadbetterella sp.]